MTINFAEPRSDDTKKQPDPLDEKANTTNSSSSSSSGSSGGNGAAAVVQVTPPTAPNPVVLPPAVPLTEAERDAQKEAEQAQLEEEMRKRRERVKAWQDAKAGQVNKIRQP